MFDWTGAIIRELLIRVAVYTDKAFIFIYGNEYMRNFALLVTTLAIIWAGYKILFGKAKAESELILTCTLVVLVNTIVFHNPRLFEDWIEAPIQNIFEGLAGSLATLRWGGDYMTPVISVIEATKDVQQLIIATWDVIDISIYDIGAAINDTLVLAIAAALMAAVTVTITIGVVYFKAGLEIVIIFGGMAAFLGCFPSTRSYFWSWLKTLTDYGVGLMIMGIIAGIANEIVPDITFSVTSSGAVDPEIIAGANGANMILGSTFIAFLIYKSGEFKSALSGGIQNSFSNAAGVMNLTGNVSNVDKSNNGNNNNDSGNGSQNNKSNAYSNRVNSEQ